MTLTLETAGCRVAVMELCCAKLHASSNLHSSSILVILLYTTLGQGGGHRHIFGHVLIFIHENNLVNSIDERIGFNIRNITLAFPLSLDYS
jgi:hypothetical protein